MSQQQFVLITGGSSGIGKEIARQYLLRGERVVITADNPAKLHEAERDLRVVSPHISSVVCDIGSADSVAAMGETILTQHGCPDVLVNNAGYATYEVFDQTSPEEIERLASVNFVGHLRCTRLFTPQMAQRRSGVIVNIASIAGQIPMAPNGIYSASKHGMVAWSETLRQELHRFDIHVVVVCPGRVLTNFFDHPTFQSRRAGPETRQTIPVSKVAQVTLQAVARRQSTVYLPKYYGLLVWMSRVFPSVTRFLLDRLIRRRTEEIYQRKRSDLVGALPR